MFIDAKDDGSGDDNWSCKSCKAPVKPSVPTNQHATFYWPDALPVAQPIVSKHWRELVLKTINAKYWQDETAACSGHVEGQWLTALRSLEWTVTSTSDVPPINICWYRTAVSALSAVDNMKLFVSWAVNYDYQQWQSCFQKGLKLLFATYCSLQCITSFLGYVLYKFTVDIDIDVHVDVIDVLFFSCCRYLL